MQDGWVGQMRKGVAEFCVLSVLARGEAYGYELLVEISKQPSLALKESTLYLMLARLEKEGLVQMRKVKSTKGPARRYFRLTDKGETRLQGMDRFWTEFVADVSILTKRGSKDGGA